MGSRKTHNDSAVDLLLELRTNTYQQTDNQERVRATLEELGRIDSPYRSIITDMLEWLKTIGEDSTVHHHLDQLVMAIENISPEMSLVEWLGEMDTDELMPEGKGDNDLSAYFRVLRALWEHHMPEISTPEDLNYKGQKTLSSHPIITPIHINRLMDLVEGNFTGPIGGSQITPADDVTCWILISVYALLRYCESVRLNIGDVWIENQRLTVYIPDSKTGLSASVHNPLPITDSITGYLNWFLALRIKQTNNDPNAPFFGSSFLGQHQNRYHTLYKWWKSFGLPGGLHELRRLGANMVRTHTNLNVTINTCRHTTSTSAPEHYLSGLCVLQYRGLRDWQTVQNGLISPTYSAKELAAVHHINRNRVCQIQNEIGITREQGKKLTLQHALSITKHRVITAQYGAGVAKNGSKIKPNYHDSRETPRNSEVHRGGD